jgi:hypothetical protein
MKHLKKYHKLNEEVEGIEEESAKPYPTVLFTDVIGSSRLWSDDPEKMEKILDEHFKIMSSIVEKYDGFIIKTIGDAFMIYFRRKDDSLLSAVKAAQEMLDQNSLNLRIGMCYGPTKEKAYKIQGFNLKDFFGNTVNIASRMETKVSPNDGFAFAILEPLKPEISEKIMSEIADLNMRKLKFTNHCDIPSDNTQTREKSARLLTDVQFFRCEDIGKLKGIDDLTVFSCKP